MKIFQKIKRLVGLFHEIDGMKHNINEHLHYMINTENKVTLLRNQLKALQALDISFHETGKIILIASVNKQDYVKIIDTPKNLLLKEWREMVDNIEMQYGAKARFIDGPHPDIKEIFDDLGRYKR